MPGVLKARSEQPQRWPQTGVPCSQMAWGHRPRASRPSWGNVGVRALPPCRLRMAAEISGEVKKPGVVPRAPWLCEQIGLRPAEQAAELEVQPPRDLMLPVINPCRKRLQKVRVYPKVEGLPPEIGIAIFNSEAHSVGERVL